MTLRALHHRLGDRAFPMWACFLAARDPEALRAHQLQPLATYRARKRLRDAHLLRGMRYYVPYTMSGAIAGATSYVPWGTLRFERNWGGPRPNSGGRRPGAGRPRKSASR